MMVYILCGDGVFEAGEGGRRWMRAMHSERETPTVCGQNCRYAVQGV